MSNQDKELEKAHNEYVDQVIESGLPLWMAEEYGGAQISLDEEQAKSRIIIVDHLSLINGTGKMDMDTVKKMRDTLKELKEKTRLDLTL